MAYKNSEDQKEAVKRHYQKNKDKIKARSYERNKIQAISDMVNRAYGINSISEEMEKCEVRCANCHRIITEKRRDDKRRTTNPTK